MRITKGVTSWTKPNLANDHEEDKFDMMLKTDIMHMLYFPDNREMWGEFTSNVRTCTGCDNRYYCYC